MTGASSKTTHLLVILTAIAVTACGAPSAGRAQWSSDPISADAVIELPTLPEARERQPDLFDDRGCWWDGDAWICGPAGHVDAEALPEDAPRALRGFVGPYYSHATGREAAEVLEATVSTARAAVWQTLGLARNSSGEVFSHLTVTAVLKDAGGRDLDRVSVKSPVLSVRPGEPVPFALASHVPVDNVAEVEWEAAGNQPIDVSVARDTEISVDWRVPYGDRERMWDDPAAPPFPFVLGGTVSSLSTSSADSPQLVVAWLDDDLRVQAIHRVPLLELDERTPASRLLPDGITRFIITETDPSLAPRLMSLKPMLWTSAGR